MVRSYGMHEDFDRKNELKAGSTRAFGLLFAVLGEGAHGQCQDERAQAAQKQA